MTKKPITTKAESMSTALVQRLFGTNKSRLASIHHLIKHGVDPILTPGEVADMRLIGVKTVEMVRKEVHEGRLLGILKGKSHFGIPLSGIIEYRRIYMPVLSQQVGLSASRQKKGASEAVAAKVKA